MFINFLEIFQLLFILLINVLEILPGDKALDALIFLQLPREKGCRGTMIFTIDAQGRVGEFLYSVHQESIIDDFLLQVAFHVMGGSLVLILVNQS